MSTKIWSYKPGSKSARTLAETLGVRVLKHEGSKYTYKNRDTIINWGSSNCPHPCLNSFGAIRTASNKLSTFVALRDVEGVRIPDYWVRREEIPADAYPIVCRTTLTGHSGAGIVIADTPNDVVDAPLYVKYVKKTQEYRIHTSPESIIFLQRKARKLDNENPDWKVRNLANGFVFVECVVDDLPADAIRMAQLTVQHLGLDFGAVDLIFNERQGVSYILEVNTACGLEQRTADAYSNFFRNL